MTITFTPGPKPTAVTQCYQQLWPTKIDGIAAQDPERVFVEYLDPTYIPDKDVHVLTFKDLANAINRLSWWLTDKCSNLNIYRGDTICFIGFPDLRYHLMLIAAMKTGIKVLFSAPPNGVPAHIKLMDETNSKALFYTEEDPIPQLRQAVTVPVEVIPSVVDLINPEPVPHFPFEAQWDQVAKQTFLYFHTSGTTGFPKARRWTYTHLAAAGPRHVDDTFHGQPLTPYELGSLNRSTPRRILIGTIVYHPAMVTVFAAAVFRGSVVILAPPHVPIPECTAERMTRWVRMSRCDCIMMFPSKLNPALHDEEYLAELQKLDHIAYAGASLDPVLANKLIPSTRICTVWGSTEIGPLRTYEIDPVDWDYFCVDFGNAGVELRERDAGRFESVFVRNDQLNCPPQAVFAAFPDLDEFATGDLFEPHPSKPHLWRFAGRADDNIILSVAQNINPTAFEHNLLEACHGLKSATMLGNGKPRPCVIVEFKSTDNMDKQLEDVWVAVQKARQGMTDYERVDRHRIIVADPSRPVPINDKGSVKRKPLMEMYKEDIDRCYE